MIIATHPGRYGDLLWALPSIRCLAAASGEPIHLRLSAKYGSAGFCALLRSQAYLASVEAIADWHIEESAPIAPRTPPNAPSTVAVTGVARGWFDCGYDGWPTPDLPRDVWRRVAAHYGAGLPELDLTTPWITLPATTPITGMDIADLSIGFTDEHFELKLGVTALVTDAVPASTRHAMAAPGSRWAVEGHTRPTSWIEAARYIVTSRVFVGCCSALHVLAVGLGVPVVCMEPNTDRLHPTFWPCGQDGPQVRLVRGNDGQSTWDSRHVAEAIRAVLNG